MTKSRKAVITGIGAVSPLGSSVESLWEALVNGRSGIVRLKSFDPTGLTTDIAGEVRDFDPVEFLGKREARRVDRFAQFALYAAEQAITDSGLDLQSIDLSRTGVYVGSGIGGITEMQIQQIRLIKSGPQKVSPFLIPKLMSNAGPGQVAIRYGFKGPNWAIATACASGTHAIGEAARTIERGDADVMVTGGAEAAVGPLGMGGFCSLKALSTRDVPPEQASCPFDADRDGFVLGEGSGMLILEEEEYAKKRGARIYAALSGYGNTSDAHHITAPLEDGSGAADAMSHALKDARVNPGDIDYINAHGTSTQLNDAMETRAIKSVFGGKSHDVAVSSTKSMTGHLLGASGGLETIVCVLAVERGVVPPTINLKHPDPECDLDYVPNEAREMDVRAVLKNSFGFGGHNAALVIEK